MDLPTKLTKVKRLKSDVWDLFTKKGTDCVCNLCGRKYKTGGGTTNLRNHILRKHPLAKSGKKKNINANSNADVNILTLNSAKKSRTDSDLEAISEKSSEESEDEWMEMDNPRENQDYQESSITSFDFRYGHDHTTDDNEVQTKTTEKSSEEASCSSSFSRTSSRSSFTQPTIVTLFKDQRSYESGGAKDVSLTQSIIYMICKDNLPLGCTEKEGMKRFLKTAVPLYKAPSRKKITTLIEQKYTALRTIVRKTLSECGRLAITTDIATIMNSTRSFIVLTTHYIDEEKIAMDSMCLGVKNLTTHHTAVNICEDLSEMFEEWYIAKKSVVAATTDNGANIVAGVKLLLGNEELHVPCFAHCLNLVVTKALGAVQEIIAIIEKVKNIVAYFKHSNVAQDNLREEQRKEGKSDGTFLYLKQEVVTRWNSTFYCLERFVLLSGHIGKILLSPVHKKGPVMLTPNELAIIEECLLLLRPFESATKDISGETYVSGSLVIPIIHCIKTCLKRIIVSQDISKTFKIELSNQVSKRLDPLEKNVLLAASTILDPRFKKIHFESPLNVANTINRIKIEILRELKNQDQVEVEDNNSDSQTQREKDRGSIWTVHDEFVEQSKQSASGFNNMGTLPTELKLYLDQPIIAKNCDPVAYWVKNKNAFPATYQVALKYITVLGASVSSERTVSLLNNIVTDKRSRLTPDHTNQLVFLSSLDNEYWEI